MNIKNHTIDIKSSEGMDFIDVTDKINDALKQHSVTKGIVNIQSLHTTMAIIVNENEPLLIQDIKNMLERLASSKAEYNHDNFDIRTVNVCDDEYDNGHSHCKAIHLPPAQLFNVEDGGLQLGTWQRVFALELDRARPRKIALQIIGV